MPLVCAGRIYRFGGGGGGGCAQPPLKLFFLSIEFERKCGALAAARTISALLRFVDAGRRHFVDFMSVTRVCGASAVSMISLDM
jgi:hypothetical protein